MRFVNFARVIWLEDRRPHLPDSRDKPLPFKNFDPASPPDCDNLDSLARVTYNAAILKVKQKRVEILSKVRGLLLT